MKTHLLGIDLGSSAVKASLIEAGTGRLVAQASSPEEEMAILSPRPGWAEQDPEEWWRNAVAAAGRIRILAPKEMQDVEAVGISYQMHGLVVTDRSGRVLRPAIIWCDGRAVEIGARALREMGVDACMRRLLGGPGNFTASKLAWVRENEPEVFSRVRLAMLPGDWLAARMTGSCSTTASGLSEAALWDFEHDEPARFVLEHFGIPISVIPPVSPAFSVQGEVGAAHSAELGIPRGAKVSYRAGDQINNAFALGALRPGDAAANAGTSGVVYGVTSERKPDPGGRVNTFLHVNHSKMDPRYGVLLCTNGAGGLYRWIRGLLNAGESGPWAYGRMDDQAGKAPPCSGGVLVLPFGNGPERSLGNRNPGASIHGVDFNSHGLPHVLRAGLEGVAFSLRHGVEVMQSLGFGLSAVRAGDANLFKSRLFRRIFSSAVGARLLVFGTDGSQGAARGAGVGAGLYRTPEEAAGRLDVLDEIRPDPDLAARYEETYRRWRRAMDASLVT